MDGVLRATIPALQNGWNHGVSILVLMDGVLRVGLPFDS